MLYNVPACSAEQRGEFILTADVISTDKFAGFVQTHSIYCEKAWESQRELNRLAVHTLWQWHISDFLAVYI